jgi:murein DD-endopeptidase MepM/ murein hydrolase activator NlpD
MRKIRRFQRMVLALKILWRMIHIRRVWRLVLQASLVVILAITIGVVWRGFGLDQNSAGAANLDDLAAATAAAGISQLLVDDPLPLHSAKTAVVSETTPAAEPAAPTTFPGIDPQITSQWLFPLKTEPYTPPAGIFGCGRTRSRIHAGIDLYAPSGTGVYAMAAGRVVSSGVFYQGLKNLVVENDDGTTIHYAELEPVAAVGDRVSQGQLIAKLRRNFDGTCMLHLEVYATVDEQPVIQNGNNDDYLYVPFEAKSYERRRDLVDPSAVYALPRP